MTIYMLSNFDMRKNGGEYHTTKHPFKLSFEKNTTIAKQPKAIIPQNIINVHLLSEVFHEDFDHNVLVGKRFLVQALCYIFILLTYNNINNINVLMGVLTIMHCFQYF